MFAINRGRVAGVVDRDRIRAIAAVEDRYAAGHLDDHHVRAAARVEGQRAAGVVDRDRIGVVAAKDRTNCASGVDGDRIRARAGIQRELRSGGLDGDRIHAASAQHRVDSGGVGVGDLKGVRASPQVHSQFFNCLIYNGQGDPKTSDGTAGHCAAAGTCMEAIIHKQAVEAVPGLNGEQAEQIQHHARHLTDSIADAEGIVPTE